MRSKSSSRQNCQRSLTNNTINGFLLTQANYWFKSNKYKRPINRNWQNTNRTFINSRLELISFRGNLRSREKIGLFSEIALLVAQLEVMSLSISSRHWKKKEEFFSSKEKEVFRYKTNCKLLESK